MRLSFKNKKQNPRTGWAKGAHEMWLAKPVPCDAKGAHGGDRFQLKFSKELHKAQRESFSVALSGGAQSKLESKDGEFCFAWPEKGDWRYAYQATIYQCVNSECDSEENALAIAHSAEQALTVEVFDKLTQVKEKSWSLAGIAANMKEMQNNAHHNFVKSPLKMAIAVTDTKHEAFHEPWVYFSFEKLKGTLWHDDLSLERGVGRSVGGGAALEGQDETDAELDELERLIGEEEEAHALGGTARGKRGGATHANALLPGGVDTEREERRRKEVFASLERTEAEAPRLQSEHDVDELSRWLVSLARRVDGLKADDDKVMALPHDPRLPPGTHTAASLRLQELDKLQRRVAELTDGLSAAMTGEWSEDGLRVATDARRAELAPLTAEFADFERDEQLAAMLEERRALERALERTGGAHGAPFSASGAAAAAAATALAANLSVATERIANLSYFSLEREREMLGGVKGEKLQDGDPKLSFMQKAKAFFGFRSQQTAEQIAYLEAKKAGYAFPHWDKQGGNDGQCLVAVKPGFLQQCVPYAKERVYGSKIGECSEAADCDCDRFDYESSEEDKDGEKFRNKMPCEDIPMEETLKRLGDLNILEYIDQAKYKWKVGCYVPEKTWAFFSDKDDASKSKCGCFLVQEKLTADEASAQEVCAYTPTQQDKKSSGDAMDQAQGVGSSLVKSE